MRPAVLARPVATCTTHRRAVTGLMAVGGAVLALVSPASPTAAAPKAAQVSFAASNTGEILDSTTRDLTFSVSGITGPLSDVRLAISLNHSYSGDLTATLVAPSGQARTIFSGAGGSTSLGTPNDGDITTDGVSATYAFADDAPLSPSFHEAGLAAATETPPGTYRASNTSQNNILISPTFANATPNGTWHLTIEDVTDPDQGFVSAATLSLTGGTATTCGGFPVTQIGTSGNDNLEGTNRRDVVSLGEGDDTFVGKKGNDVVCGGPGNDIIYGNTGKDRLYGEAGNDALFGGKNRDTCDGGDGGDAASRCERRAQIP